MEAKFTRTEIEKLVKKTLAHTKGIRWEGVNLWVDIDTFELDKESIRGLDVWTHDKEIELPKVRYCICTAEKDGKKRHFIVMQ